MTGRRRLTTGYAPVEIHDKNSFGYQDYLLPLNRWNEEPEINGTVAEQQHSKQPAGEADQ